MKNNQNKHLKFKKKKKIEWKKRVGMKEGYVLFNDTTNTFYLSLWHETYGKGPLNKRKPAATWATLSN